MTDDKPKCAECGDSDGVVQHVDIAWPKRWDETRGAVQSHSSAWLHPECETVHIARLEQAQQGRKQ
jgi:hypothetical protein